MELDIEENNFVGFEIEEVERVRLLRNQLSSDKFDIFVVSSDSDSSESEGEEEIVEDVWLIDDFSVRVRDFI